MTIGWHSHNNTKHFHSLGNAKCHQHGKTILKIHNSNNLKIIASYKIVLLISNK